MNSVKDSSHIPEKKNENDFIFGKLIGEGSFSTVYLAKDRHTEKEYAAKVCSKLLITREKKVKHVMREKDIMNILNKAEDVTAPFFVKLAYAFQCNVNLYFILSYCKHGELLDLIKNVGNFDHESASFYTGEMLKGLEHLHSLNIVHRDLKPENILLDDKMHIKISDFGSAKILEKVDSEEPVGDLLRSSSFVGTAQYVSPEVLQEKKVCFASDLWSLGCIIYQIVSGLPPFRAKSEYMIFKGILGLNYEFPSGFFDDAQDLVKKLLILDASGRLGARDKGGQYSSIRSHAFLAHLNLDTLYLANPPIITTYTPDTSDQCIWSKDCPPGLAPRELDLLHELVVSKPNKMKVVQNAQSPSSQPQPPANDKTEAHSSTQVKNSNVPLPVQPNVKPAGLQTSSKVKNLANITIEEHNKRLAVQEKESKWHRFVDGHLILKQGLLDKRKASVGLLVITSSL
ncbi:Protein kinase domain [Trinorchestia longiramus]|nr:Protein kinase domain [Trinorchestia longiramus]